MTNDGATRAMVAGVLLAVLAVTFTRLAGPRTAPTSDSPPPKVYRKLLEPPSRAAVNEHLAATLMQRGKRVYEACVACHLPTGVGVPGTNPPLIGSHIADAPPGRLIRAMLHGVEGPLTIDGEEYEGVMPPAQVETDDDLAAVLTYIRRSWGNAGSAVTPAMVRAVREATREHEGHWTTEDLNRIVD
ncbi:MAG: hypothetical protein HBSAPP03_29460 [Phycisphaerae bacterium]|nr:MAG: hypothetical protein HBSAPP03_29460 [Phycisphaerae bacterium]